MSQAGENNSMISLLLERLKTDDFQDEIGFLLPPVPLRRVLQHSFDVHRLQVALRFGEVKEREFRDFVREVMADFRVGESFRYQLTLAALAVAVERCDDSFAEEYLLDLARLVRPELSTSFRVARECLRVRYSLPKNDVRTARYPGSQRNPGSHTNLSIRIGHPTRSYGNHEWFASKGVRYCEEKQCRSSNTSSSVVR